MKIELEYIVKFVVFMVWFAMMADALGRL